MFLHFKANVNDKYDTKIVYRKGEVYELDDKRAKELLKTLPSLVEEVVKDKKHRAPRSKSAVDETNKDAATDLKPESNETAEQDGSSTPQEPESAVDETNKNAATDLKPESNETAEQDGSSTPQEPESAVDETNKE